MTASDRTAEFRDLLREKEKGVPESKRRKLSRSTKREQDHQRDAQEALNREYITEGYNIVRMSAAESEGLLPIG
jgi:syntaxin 18